MTHKASYVLEGEKRYIYCDTVTSCTEHPAQNIVELWQESDYLSERVTELEAAIGQLNDAYPTGDTDLLREAHKRLNEVME